MMTPRNEQIATYNFQPSDKLLLDANIWLFVFGPQRPKDTRVDTYSQALKNIFDAKCRIYIDVLIVSEFINTYANIKRNLLPKLSRLNSSKQFRKSASFKPIAKEIADKVKRMLKDCTRIENGFNSLPIETLIAEYAKGNSDFNDQVLAELCKKQGLKLVTDDADFKGQGIPVITANKRLLN